MAYLMSGYQRGYDYLVGLESFKKINSGQIREKNLKKIHHKKFRFVPSIAAADESGGD